MGERCYCSLSLLLVCFFYSFAPRPTLSSQLPKHEQKCKKYAESVTSVIADPTGFGGEVTIDHCVNNVETLIHGGENATSKEFPFMALVGFGPGPQVHWKCGGSLISEDFVLSAAHCSYNKRVGYAQWVRLGDLDISTESDDAAPIDIAIVERILYKGYTEKTKYHDIALFRLAKKVTFSPYIRPICLYDGPHVNQQKNEITGWGATERGKFSALLQKARVKLTSEQQCNESYNQRYLGLPLGLNWTTMVCAKGDNLKDTCRGDSGGPLFISITDKYYCMKAIVGVTSFGKECDSSSPGVYTRVSYYLPWIESIVWPN